jgi:copper chaperone CopZ
MCCEKCAKKVKDRLLDLEGVENVVTDQYNQKVMVYGHVDPARVLQRVKKVKKRSAFWDMAVDYSEEYRRSCYEQAEYARAKVARAESSKAEYQTKALRAPNPSNAPSVIVNLPQAHNGPLVTAILPAETKNAAPYIANTRTRSQRYVRLPKADRHEFYHEGSQPRHAQGEYYYVLRDQHEG